MGPVRRLMSTLEVTNHENGPETVMPYEHKGNKKMSLFLFMFVRVCVVIPVHCVAADITGMLEPISQKDFDLGIQNTKPSAHRFAKKYQSWLKDHGST